MLKHLDDDGDLNMLIDDGGSLIIVCSKCKKIWHDKLTMAESPASAKKVTIRMMESMLTKKPFLLKQIGIDAQSIAILKARIK